MEDNPSLSWSSSNCAMEWECDRCGGLKIAERFYCSDSTVAMWVCNGFRCLNRGAIWFVDRTHLGRPSDSLMVKKSFVEPP